MTKRVFQSSLLLILSFGTSGCLLERITWSPDGSTAAVIGLAPDRKTSLYFCDSTGKLSQPLASDVYSATWFPDGQRLVLARYIEKVRDWEEAKPALSEAMQASVIAEAEALAKELSVESGWQDVQSRLYSRELTEEKLRLLWIVLKDVKQDPLAKKLWDKWLMYEPVLSLTYLQMARINGEIIELDPPLVVSTSIIQGIRISPDGDFVAYTAPIGRLSDPNEAAHCALYIVSTSGQQEWATPFWSHVAAVPDWTPTGEVVYIRSNFGGPIRRIGTVAIYNTQRRAERELAVVAFDPRMRIRSLSDGRFVFSGTRINLPATLDDQERPFHLFSDRPGVADHDRIAHQRGCLWH